ncbi:MAG: hypothetical protein PHX54_08605 [Lentimicrobiaceae bacterium]|nr:hypothetical protein [Lentimicrobiaceae bacterium]
MKTFTTIGQAINFAISSASECAEFFDNFSNQARNSLIRKQFAGFSRNEFAQIATLSKILIERPVFIRQPFSSLPFQEQIEKAQCHHKEAYGYLQTLIMALRRAQLSKMLFTELANQSPDKELKETFMMLAKKKTAQFHDISCEFNETFLVFS